MEENKTLVEQLRKMVEKSRENGGLPTWYTEGLIADGYYESGEERERDLFTTIADRIEREYMQLTLVQRLLGIGTKEEAEVLDTDGVPIIVGDVVYFVDSAEAFDVLGVESDGDEPVHIGRKDGTSTDAWVSPGDLTHKQPDTLEHIEADASKMFNDYWGCRDADCSCCPAMVDGKKPWERYENSGNCTAAQKLDLLRRQREVLHVLFGGDWK